MRTGAAWDLLAVVALVAPLAGVAAPLAGGAGRGAVVVGRGGALAAAGVWTALVAAGAAPTLGAFDPDPLTLAALAGTALLAAALAGSARPGTRRDPVATLAAPVAAVVGLAVGLVDAPDHLASARTATAVVLGASLVAVVLVLALRGNRRGPALLPLVGLLLPAALLVALRSTRSVPVDDPDAVLAAAGPAAALLAAATAWAPGRLAGLATVAGPLLVAAAALSPVGSGRAAAGLLAAAVVLSAAVPAWWTVAAFAPGLAVLAAAAADLPAPGDPGLALPVWGLAVAGAATGLVAGIERDRAGGARTLEVRVAAAALTGWLLVGPGHWRWAGAPVEALAAWERAAAVAVSVLVGAGALGAALHLAPRPDRKPDTPAG